MAIFTSEKREINSTPEKLFNFLGELENLGLIMPQQVEEWQSDGEECSFYVKNLGHLGLKKGKADFTQRMVFSATEHSKVKFDLIFILEKAETYLAGFEIDAAINPMLEMMARRPLTNFVNILTENLVKQLNN
jgi:hypothetical protein